MDVIKMTALTREPSDLRFRHNVVEFMRDRIFCLLFPRNNFLSRTSTNYRVLNDVDGRLVQLTETFLTATRLVNWLHLVAAVGNFICHEKMAAVRLLLCKNYS